MRVRGAVLEFVRELPLMKCPTICHSYNSKANINVAASDETTPIINCSYWPLNIIDKTAVMNIKMIIHPIMYMFIFFMHILPDIDIIFYI